MNLRGNPSFKAGNFAALEAKLVPVLVSAAGKAAQAAFVISQSLVHVRSGELKASGVQPCPVEWVGQKVTGYVSYTAKHAAYNEFGTGRRGEASPGAGPYPYNPNWPGMAAIPFIRPALDAARPQILAAFKAALQP
jgi:hypothetical protein